MSKETTVTVTRDLIPCVRHRGLSAYRGLSICNPGPDDLEVVMPIRTYLLSCGLQVDDTSGAVISEAKNENIKEFLLSQYGVVVEASLVAVRTYLEVMEGHLRKLIRAYAGAGSSKEGNSFSDFLDTLSRMSGIGTPVGESARASTVSISEHQTVYFTGIPKHLMLGLWARYTNKPVLLHVATEEGPVTLDLVSQVAPLCSDYRSIQSAGCISCPNRSDCVGHLIEQELPTGSPPKEKLHRVVAKRFEVLPPSDCAPNRYNNERISLVDIDMTYARATHLETKQRRADLARNRAFAQKNCSKCALNKVCGSGKSYTRRTIGMSTVCSGSRESLPEVNEDNYLGVFRVLIRSLLLGSGQGSAKITNCLEYIEAWVEQDVTMPYHAAHYFRTLCEERQSGNCWDQYYVIPKQLLRLAELINLYGGFKHQGSRWYGDDIHVGAWVEDVTNRIAAFSPFEVPEGDWAIVAPQYKSLAAKVGNQRKALSQCVDTRVMADYMGISYRRPSKHLSTKEARIQLAAEFINCFLIPSQPFWCGPFASRRLWLPSGIPAHVHIRDTRPAFPKESAMTNVTQALSRLRKLSIGDELMVELLKSGNELKDI